MTLVKVQPDTEWGIVEMRLRFSVDYSVPEKMLYIHNLLDLTKAIDILERTRGWHFLTKVPARKQFLGGAPPCCAKVAAAPSGTPLEVWYEKSDLQADSDDAHNFNEVSDGTERFYSEGLIDWVAVCHFWQKGIWLNKDEVFEGMQSLNRSNGFVSPEESKSAKVKEIWKKWQST